jgi:hypothetical protein
VFDNMGRKAYFDFNRDLSTSNFIDVSISTTTPQFLPHFILIPIPNSFFYSGRKEGMEASFHDGCDCMCFLWYPAEYV